jgi:hypothetical protein
VRYTGWGAFAQALFNLESSNSTAQTWAAERAELQDLLTTAEWESARASTINAHYTSYEVITGIWQAIQHLGFEGGRALEPAAGVGHFIGLVPNNLKPRTAWSAVELDSLSGRITRALYPGADVRIEGFENAKWPDGYFDLAISNVPFGDYGVADRKYRHLSIHDYFFVKALDKVRPGGIVAFITSHFTLDKKAEGPRREIAKRADFLGAIRLPGGRDGAFAANAGTEVTTDIVFLQKRDSSQSPNDTRWLSLKTIETPDGPIEINEYFADNPHMMLGEMRLEKKMFATPSPVLINTRPGDADLAIPDDLGFRIALAAQSLPKNVYRPPNKLIALPQRPMVDASGQKEDAFFVEGGKLYQRKEGVAIEPDFSAIDRAKVTELVAMRDIVNELLKPPAAGSSQARDELRRRLEATYDRFVKRHGPINKTVLTTSSRLRKDGTPITLRRMPNFSKFREDPDAFKVAVIEYYEETTGFFAKGPIFTHDIVRTPETPRIAEPSDALAVSLNQTGRIDLELIASLLEMDEEDARDALGDRIWLDPAGDVWRTAADYLSGDVVLKLEDARIAARDDGSYARNVAALEAVQPAPLTRVDIRILFGAPWVPADVYKTFLAETLSIKADGLTLGAVSKKWQFTQKPEIPASAEAQYATSRSSAKDVIEAAINNAEIRIFDANPDPNGSPIYNAAASEESNVKVAALREAFSGSPETGVEGWIWQDEDRARRLEELYNAKFNRLVPTVYDGAHQTMPGLARYIGTGPDRSLKPFKLNVHQLNAIWRIVSSGNTLIDHAVGAGKTFTMIGAGQEQKRLGLIRRPMYVVPNHMLEQVRHESRLSN